MSAVQRLLELKSLENGWDGYGALPLRSDVVLFVLDVLNGAMRISHPLPQLVPLTNGGIQVEWHERGLDIELAIYEPYQCELYVCDHHSHMEECEDLSSDFTRFHQALDELSKRN